MAADKTLVEGAYKANKYYGRGDAASARFGDQMNKSIADLRKKKDADKAVEDGEHHPLHGKGVGEIFSTYVDRNMKDVHFFFDLAYKTSGFLPGYKEATDMVRHGDSLDAIIENVQQIGA